MLKLQNVGKTYVTKSKTETQALKDVNLEIANRGMVFILGKSGSGKSTLLNLLGGLDAPTSGEIFVDGTSMRQFSQADYAAYRNEHVGFIFQEFNLLADFNVRDNVALALQLSKDGNVEEKISNALKQVELDDGYLSRRIDEMSGGEKQRIAIARAIIKQSKLILADEPTGNLDSATGESIWNILKNLSRDRLVVVVSHDRESAEKYADRIIEISDGQIISDKGVQPSVEESAEVKTASKSRLPFRTLLKMGYNNLKLRKVKAVSVILVAIFSILSIVITQVCLCFSPEVALANHIKQNGIDYFTVDTGKYEENPHRFSTSGNNLLKYGTRQYISANSKYIKDGVVSGKREILDFGLTFIGEALELDDYSFYATSAYLEKTYEEGLGNVEVDGEYVQIVKEYHPVEFLIGKKVVLYAGGNTQEGILAGVINDKKLTNPSALPNCFYNKNFNAQTQYLRANSEMKSELTLQLGDRQYCDRLEVSDRFVHLFGRNNVIVTADGLWKNVDEVTLADNEIVLPYLIYARIFNAKSQGYYINYDLSEVLEVPQEIGQTFDLKFYEYDTDELLADYGKVKLAGVSFSDVNSSSDDSTKYTIAVGADFCRRISMDLISTPILIQTSSVKNVTKFVTDLRRKELVFVSNAGIVDRTEQFQNEYYIGVSELAYDFDEFLKFVSIGFLVLCVIMVTVFVLLVINLISFSIANRKKEIGILSALGASNKDVTGMFLLETCIIAVISFVFALALSFGFVALANFVFSKSFTLVKTFAFLNVGIITVITLVAAAFVVPLLATLIPLRKIMKLKPIDAIRNV